MSITNNNKRKGRIPNNTNSRPKPLRARPKGLTERSIALDGVYSNARFMHAAASFVGCIVHVQVRNGNIYEGVFSTFSQDLDIVLDMVNLIDKSTSFGDICAGNCTSNNSILNSFKVEDCVAEKMIFKLSDVVATCAGSIDLDYATKDGFTDGAISKNFGGNTMTERELEPWDGGANEEVQTTNSANSLDGEDEGWDANEMFRTNAEKYNVKSTYDSSLYGYTIPLEPKNTDEYKKQEAKASKIAQEIENNPSYKQRISMENGDEEERYSAVLRPVDNVSNSASRYVTHKKNIPGGKMVRNPVPSFVHQSKSPNQQMSNINSSITPTHSFNKNNSVPQPPNSLPIMPSTPLNGNIKPLHMGPLQMTSPLQQHLQPNQAPPPRLMGNIQQPRTPLNHSGPPPPLHHVVAADSMNKEVGSDKHDSQPVENAQEKTNSGDYRSFQDENVAPALNQTQVGPGKNAENRRDDPNKVASGGRDERGRDLQIAEFKKFSSDFKLTEDHRPAREDSGGRDASSEECTPPPSNNQQKDKTPSSGEELADNDCSTPDSDGNKVKKSVLNPNAKAFTPRAVPAATPPAAVSIAATAVLPPRLHTQSPVVAVPQHQIVPGLGQPIFTPMGPQYVVSGTPVSMSLTTSFPPASMTTAHRFRKAGPMGVPTQQDFTPSVHVAAATGQPILTPGLPSPAQLAVQYNPAQGMMAPSPHQTPMAYPQMMYRYPTMMGTRVVSPQQVGTYGEVFMAPHPSLQGPVSVSAVQSMVPQGNAGPHSNPQNQQSQPMHTAPSPVHQQGNQTPHGTPSQTPTPSGGHVAPSTTPQSVVYHHHQMAQSMQGGLHTPPSTQALQAIHASHINQSHPHANPHSFATTQQIVLMHQHAIPAHGPHAGALSSGPHSLQGHAIHGQASNHLGNPGGPHVLQHPGPISVIPTSSAMVHAPMGPGNPFGPHPHQARERGRQHAANR